MNLVKRITHKFYEMKPLLFIRNIMIACFAIYISSIEVYSMKLSEALALKKVRMEAKWTANYNTPLQLKLQNLSPTLIEIEVEAGSHFQCLDDKAQDMLAMKNYTFKLAANKSGEKSLKVHCMEKHDYGPHLDADFEFIGRADEKLVKIAQLTASTDKFSGISQSLVWALAEKDVSFQYSKGDSVAYWPMLKAASEYLKLEPYNDPNYVYVPIPRFTYNSRINISSYIKPNTKLTLKGIDNSGKIVKEYYANKPVAAGFYNVTIGYNDIVMDSTFAITYQLSDEKGTLLFEKHAKNKTMEAAEKIYWLQTGWEMNIQSAIPKASLKLFGPDEKLLLVLYENKNIPVSIRKTPYAFYHTYGKQAKFKVRLYDDVAGKMVQEVIVDGAKSEEQKVLMKKK